MTYQINADFSQLIVVRTNDMEWQKGPAPGIWRKRLELVGELEAGRVTSLVRFDPGATQKARTTLPGPSKAARCL